MSAIQSIGSQCIQMTPLGLQGASLSGRHHSADKASNQKGVDFVMVESFCCQGAKRSGGCCFFFQQGASHHCVRRAPFVPQGVSLSGRRSTDKASINRKRVGHGGAVQSVRCQSVSRAPFGPKSCSLCRGR